MMAIVRESRDRLAWSLGRLVAGRMTNDAFDDEYYELFRCEDAAVREIGTFGWGLYSSDLPVPYRLDGWHAVSGDVAETARRAISFLQTDLEYEWPTNVQGVIPYFCLWGPGCYLTVGLILLFCAAFTPGYERFGLGIVGVMASVPTVHWLATRRRRHRELEAFYASGDFAVWPFTSRDEFDRSAGEAGGGGTFRERLQ